MLGLALPIYNEVVLELLPAPPPGQSILIEGEGRDVLPTDDTNLVFRAVRRVFERAGRPVTVALRRCVNRIPLDRGLGSSSAAIVGGLVAANALLDGAVSRDELLAMAVEMEGHPDNVTPALRGGLCAAVKTAGGVASDVWAAPALFAAVRAVVCIPEFRLPTREARAVLPATLSREDAVFNVGRVALFLSAMLHSRYDLLSEAMDDRLHQPSRKKLIPGFDGVIAAAKAAGAYGACLSGAGPTILAFAPATGSAARATADAMRAAFQRAGVSSRTEVLAVDVDGARVVDGTSSSPISVGQ